MRILFWTPFPVRSQRNVSAENKQKGTDELHLQSLQPGLDLAKNSFRGPRCDQSLKMGLPLVPFPHLHWNGEENPVQSKGRLFALSLLV